MNIQEVFLHCPRCGEKRASASSTNPYRCTACNFEYYFNIVAATAVYIARSDGKVLFIRRGKEPGKGKLAPPGGFVDEHETAEEAAIREAYEEVHVQVDNLVFLGSFTNLYSHRGLTCHVLDAFFAARAISTDLKVDGDEVSDYLWLSPEEVNIEDLAFQSMKSAWLKFLSLKNEKVPT